MLTLIGAALLAAGACSNGGGASQDAGDEVSDQIGDGDAGDSGCPAGQIRCDSTCIDPASNHEHCGACGNGCEAIEVCSGGECLMECPGGRISCGGSCVDITVDPANCGNCGVVCSAGSNAQPVCINRVCTIRCNEGWSDRDGDKNCETNCSGTSDVEICNGFDDDCDGDVDEGFPCRKSSVTSCTTSCGSTGTGTCAENCIVPQPEACSPTSEICNGEDDDCDDSCDEEFSCCAGDTQPCTTSCGSTGTVTCTASCSLSSCQAPVEACNGRDDDCDTLIDEELYCTPGETQACTASGSCTGTQTCQSDCTWTACANPAWTCTSPGLSEACTTTCASTGTRVCGSDCTWSTCVPPAEACNGLDDDCAGGADNGFNCVAGSTRACTVECGDGVETCGIDCTAWSECSDPAWTCTDPGARDETCNPTGTVCPGRRTCSAACQWGECGEQCRSPTPQCCPLGCVNRLTDENNCGSCGNVCPTHATCCWGICADLMNDPSNCGYCGTICPYEYPTCINGLCY
jgi:hypothetical protein